MGDKGEVNPQPSKKIDKERGKEMSDQRQGEGSLEQVAAQVEEQIIDAESRNGIWDQADDKPSASIKLWRNGWQVDGGHVEGTGKRSDDFVQDQIIITPEIMSMILAKLDMRSLKNCRCVCKSWLLEAQSHLEQRTIVRFQDMSCSGRMTAFKRTRQKKLLKAFPKPFSSLDVELFADYGPSPFQLPLKQLHGILVLPIVLTRFSPGRAPLRLTLPVITECSSSLEYLKLEYNQWVQKVSIHPIPKQKFPKLRHIDVISTGFSYELRSNNYPLVVASIVNNSPNLDTFRSTCYGSGGMELGSELLLKVNIKSVKSLILSGHSFNRAAADLFNSIRFSRLQNLKLDKSFLPSTMEEMSAFHHAVLATVRNSVDTLKKLVLPMFTHPEFEKLLLETGFPVCPSVEELTVRLFTLSWVRIIANSFPELHSLNAGCVDLNSLENLWSDLPPYLGIKTLRAICMYQGDTKELSVEFFEKFPELEKIHLDAETLMGCCRLKATGDPKFANLLKCVKHLVLHGNALDRIDTLSLGALRGIETITMVSSNMDIFCIPFQDLPVLRMIQFPWGACLDLEKLLEMARAVERVIVTNCCSVPRLGNQQSKELLNQFFESAPNAECGCSMDRKQIPE